MGQKEACMGVEFTQRLQREGNNGVERQVEGGLFKNLR